MDWIIVLGNNAAITTALRFSSIAVLTLGHFLRDNNTTTNTLNLEQSTLVYHCSNKCMLDGKRELQNDILAFSKENYTSLL